MQEVWRKNLHQVRPKVSPLPGVRHRPGHDVRVRLSQAVHLTVPEVPHRDPEGERVQPYDVQEVQPPVLLDLPEELQRRPLLKVQLLLRLPQQAVLIRQALEVPQSSNRPPLYNPHNSSSPPLPARRIRALHALAAGGLLPLREMGRKRHKIVNDCCNLA